MQYVQCVNIFSMFCIEQLSWSIDDLKVEGCIWQAYLFKAVHLGHGKVVV